MVGFSRDGARRVVASTKYVERVSRSGKGRNKIAPINGGGDLLAELGAVAEGKYAWTALRQNENATGSDDALIKDEEWGTGSIAKENFAVEFYGYEHCKRESKVWLRLMPNGTYVFEWSGTVSGVLDESIAPNQTGVLSSGDYHPVVKNPYSQTIEQNTKVVCSYGFGELLIVGAEC